MSNVWVGLNSISAWISNMQIPAVQYIDFFLLELCQKAYSFECCFYYNSTWLNIKKQWFCFCQVLQFLSNI